MPKKKTRSTRRTVAHSRPAAQATAAASSSAGMQMSFVQLLSMLVGLFIANSLVTYVAHLLFPGHIVLGNHQIDPWSALFMAMAILSVVDVGATPVIQLVSDMFKLRLANRDWMVLYFVINAVTLWFIGRLAEMVGMGISSWLVAGLLSLVLTGVQSLVAAKVATPAK